MPERTPADRYAKTVKEEEIGGTKGQTHEDVLTRTLGRERGLRVATGVGANEAPVVVGDEPPNEREQEAGTGNATPKRPPADEITKKKVERHGDVGGES